MKIAIVDDDNALLNSLEEMLVFELSQHSYTLSKIDKFCTGEAFLSSFTPAEYDLIVLDIYMGGILGIDVARKIRESDKEVRLVFCTSSNEYASESYEVGAHYYLHKPFTHKSIGAMVERLNLENYELGRGLTLPDGIHIVLRNIVYTEYAGHSVLIHNKRGEDVVSKISQSELEARLCEFSFFICCSKGVVVNFFEVISLDNDLFTMSNGAKISVSRRRAKDVSAAYATFRFEQMRKEMRR